MSLDDELESLLAELQKTEDARPLTCDGPDDLCYAEQDVKYPLDGDFFRSIVLVVKDLMCLANGEMLVADKGKLLRELSIMVSKIDMECDYLKNSVKQAYKCDLKYSLRRILFVISYLRKDCPPNNEDIEVKLMSGELK